VKGSRSLKLDREADPAPLVRAYLAAYGPATPADMQTWSGLAGLRAVFEAMRDDLEVFRGPGGSELFDLPDAPRPDRDTPAPPRLLPEFDNLVLAHRDRTRVLADEHRREVVTKNLRVRATFLLDGRVRGTWRLERRKGKATLWLSAFGSLPTRWTKALTAEAEGMARFLEEDAASVDVKIE
jgi:Winged helix DNA-binding domain